jgi:SprT protein
MDEVTWLKIKQIIDLHDDLSFTLTKPRTTKFADYRYYYATKKSKISLNNNMTSIYSWIIFLHEYAHYLVKKKHTTYAPHGVEWKNCFRLLLQEEILNSKDFSSEKIALLKTFWRKPTFKPKYEIVSNSPIGLTLDQLDYITLFTVRGKGPFVKIKKRRTKFLCTNKVDGRDYLISEFATVEVSIELSEEL